MTTAASGPPIELVALLASAGGLASLSTVLSDLPTGFPAALVVQQHLGGHSSSVLPNILSRRTAHQVVWARDGQTVVAGQVLVCPPGTNMELNPDGSCCLSTLNERGERRFDVLLTSLARSYGARGIAVVLSGSGSDGFDGTVAMKGAGAVVIAESPDTAQYPAMPRAAAQAGADLVLPVCDIGRVLTDLVGGARLSAQRGGLHGIDTAATQLDSAMTRQARETGQETSAAPEEQRQTGPATTDHATRLSSYGADFSPAARAEAARLRVAELRRRRHDLAAGRNATPQTVAMARRRAEESLNRAIRAQQAAERAARRSTV